MKLIASVLRSLETFAGGKGAAIFILQETYRETGANVEMTERLINYPRSLVGVEVAVAFRQLEEEGVFKVSFRSSGRADVNALARRFGGGGHIHASGCTLRGALDEVKGKVYRAIEEIVAANNG
ncbi:MAG: hypothetical protein Kow0090_06070 [Myxococcota bacterium]